MTFLSAVAVMTNFMAVIMKKTAMCLKPDTGKIPSLIKVIGIKKNNIMMSYL